MATVIESMTGVRIKSPFFGDSKTLELFPDISKNGTSPKRNRVALLYGTNGSGKSTLAQGFREYTESTIPRTVELVPLSGANQLHLSPNGRPERIFVFDETYISNNIKLQQDGLGSIVLFGHQVEIEQRIKNIEQMLTVAQYMLYEGNVMYYLKDYAQEHKVEASTVPDDAQISRMFSELREEDRMLFFREWMKVKKPKEYVAYDVTSVSSYSKGIEDLEWGYNRDKEKLPQVNVGLYYGEGCGLPLYYRVYPGSISDKAHLKYMTAGNGLIDNRKTRATPHNCVSGSQRIFCAISAVPKTGNTYSIPPFLKL